MNAVPFDPQNTAKSLVAAGCPTPQAAGESKAVAEALVATASATKADINALLAEPNGSIGSLQAEMHGEFSLVRSAIESIYRDMTIRLGEIMLLAAAWRRSCG